MKGGEGWDGIREDSLRGGARKQGSCLKGRREWIWDDGRWAERLGRGGGARSG